MTKVFTIRSNVLLKQFNFKRQVQYFDSLVCVQFSIECLQILNQMSTRRQRKPLPYSSQPYNQMKEKGSPSKASVLLQQDHAEYIESLRGRKENFCTCLQLYQVSYEHGMAQKCLVHNNLITLYCQNQSKLLCVNCIFGSASHKDHRVVPSKNSLSNIAQDNQYTLSKLAEELSKVKYVDEEVKKNKKNLEDEYRTIMKQIDEEFKLIFDMVNIKYSEIKERITGSFERATSLNDMSNKQVSWWRDLLIKTERTLPKRSADEDAQIYKHLVLNLFMQEQIDEEKLTYFPSGQEIRSQFLRDAVQLRQLIQERIGYSQNQRARGKRVF